MTFAGTPVLAASGLIPIEQLQVGDRVATAPAGEQCSETDVDPATWRKVTLVLEDDSEDGSRAEITTLVPREESEEEALEAEDDVYLDRAEWGIEGWARVERVEDCPPIAPGSGRVVVSTFRRQAPAIQELRFAGQAEPIRTTPEHPFYSVSRDGWVAAGQLQPGEQVRTLSGFAVVSLSELVLGATPVFNLEVEEDHCYLVGADGLLVHNACRRHRANWELRDSRGRIKTRGSETSGGTKPGRRLTFPEQQKVHTEGKVIAKTKGKTKPGDIVTIRGQKKPCGMCDRAMDKTAKDRQIRIDYTDGGGKTSTYGGIEGW